MRKLAFTLALAAALALSASGTPAPAADHAPTGGHINLVLGTPTTYPAGEPFSIQHGWGIAPEDPPAVAGVFSFALDVDGIRRAEDFVIRTTTPTPASPLDAPILNRGWVFNFPDGMTGTHTFTGHWIVPCRYSGATTCRTPNDPTDQFTRTLTVTFVRTNLALGKSATASSEYPGNPASLAVDGDWYSYWNSGNFPPQWLEVDLGSVEPVGEVDLGITQLPDSPTIHRLYGRASASDPWTLLREFNGFTVDQQTLRYTASAPQQLRYIRIETTFSWSWVAWREVEVYRFGG